MEKIIIENIQKSEGMRDDNIQKSCGLEITSY